jgi:oxygen-independent coproporphyrinogen-3 oxidase
VVEALAERLVAEGLAERAGSRFWLTNRGRLLADTVGAEIMAAFEIESAKILL